MFPQNDSVAEWGEEEIAEHGDTYDIKAKKEDLVYRHITNWYVTQSLSATCCPVPLASSAKDLARQQETENKYILHGELLPRDSSHKKLPIKMSKFGSWGIDFRSSFRGIWITTEQAWYWLKEPSTEQREFKLRLKGYNNKPLIARFQSQERLHLELRAQFGLVSNLFDIFVFDDEDEESHEYRKMHANKTPQALHESLKPSTDMLLRFPNRAKEAFDLALLKRYPSFVKLHLAGLHQDFEKPCVFMENLKNPSSQKFSSQDFERSAQLAERRSFRTPFGELLKDVERFNPNWVIQESLEVACKQSQAKEADRSRNNFKEESRREILVNNCDNTIPLEQTSVHKEKIDLLMLSDVRMKRALNEMFEDIQLLLPGKINADNAIWSSCSFSSIESAARIIKKMNTDHIQTWEHKLLIAKCANGACCSSDVKSAKQFVKCFLKDKDGDSGMKILCEVWTGEALERIKSINDIAGESLLFHLLLNVGSLIENCKIISKATQLDNLKEKRGIDWERGITEISIVSNKASPELQRKITMGCNNARCRLVALRSQNYKGNINQGKNILSVKNITNCKQISKTLIEDGIENNELIIKEVKIPSIDMTGKSATDTRKPVSKRNETLPDKIPGKGDNKKKRGTELRRNLMKERLKQSVARSMSVPGISHSKNIPPIKGLAKNNGREDEGDSSFSNLKQTSSCLRDYSANMIEQRSQSGECSWVSKKRSSSFMLAQENPLVSSARSNWTEGNSWGSVKSVKSKVALSKTREKLNHSKKFSSREAWEIATGTAWKELGGQKTVDKIISDVHSTRIERMTPQNEIPGAVTYGKQSNSSLSDEKRDYIISSQDEFSIGQGRKQYSKEAQNFSSHTGNRDSSSIIWKQKERIKDLPGRIAREMEECRGESVRANKYDQSMYSKQGHGDRSNQGSGVENVKDYTKEKNSNTARINEGRPTKIQRLSEASSRSRGHGMGRGKQTTLPAWMTKKEREIGPSTALIQDSESRRDYQHQFNRDLPAKKEKKGSVEMQNMCDESKPKQGLLHQSGGQLVNVVPPLHSGRGRGIALTRPAWMTKDLRELHAGENIQKDTINSLVYGVESAQVRRNNFSQQTAPVMKSRSLSSNSSSQGAGRGKQRTLPAWMTKNGNY